jgi:hypothetical protein
MIKKNLHRFASTQKDHILTVYCMTKMNDNINMDNTIPGSMKSCNSLKYMIILTDLLSVSHI